MSFTRDIKSELLKQTSNARHCRLAELAALLELGGGAVVSGEEQYLYVSSENPAPAEKFAFLVKKLFFEEPDVALEKNGRKKIFVSRVSGDTAKKILDVLKVKRDVLAGTGQVKASGLLTQQLCCRRAYLRGAFMASGSLSDPEKTYHFEIVVKNMDQAGKVEELLNSFDLEAKTIIRKEKYIVVYIKDGSKIVDALNVMEAHVSMMNLENVRILKEMRNNVNRQVNCEAANLTKTVMAANKQIEDIMLIDRRIGLSKLAEGLEEVARLRLEYPDSSLSELSDMMCPPVGKSGVNHRLKKISQIADSLRE